MAKITELILDLKKTLDQFGDMQVVFRHNDNKVSDILSCGVSKAIDIKDQDIKVYWMAGVFTDQIEPTVK